jgi:hypothetical protein
MYQTKRSHIPGDRKLKFTAAKTSSEIWCYSIMSLCARLCVCSVSHLIHLADSIKVGMKTLPLISVAHLYFRIHVISSANMAALWTATHARVHVAYKVKCLVVIQYQKGRRHLFSPFHQAGESGSSYKTVELIMFTHRCGTNYPHFSPGTSISCTISVGSRLWNASDVCHHLMSSA